MPIYVEKIKDPKTGKMIEKKVDGQKQYYIRTYVEDDTGRKKQIKRHNKKWLGRNGYNLALQEEVRLKNAILLEENKINNITLHELKLAYLEYWSTKVDSDTLKYKETLLNHICEYDNTKQVDTYPNRPVKLITKKTYESWKQQMLNKQYYRGQYSYNYSLKRLNCMHNEISSMYNFAIINGMLVSNIPKQVGGFGTAKEIKMSKLSRKYETIDYGEYLALMEATRDNHKYNTIFDLMFTCGPRIGEIRAFRILDYNYNKKSLMVNHSLSKKNELKDPKTASSKAPIDLDDIVSEKINHIIDELKKDPDFSDKWYLFGNKYMPISSHAIDYNKNKYFKMAQINKHLRLHDFRHSCATWLFSLGIPITVISRILRHSDIGITMKTYTHLVEEDYNNSLSKIANLKKGTSPNTSPK